MSSFNKTRILYFPHGGSPVYRKGYPKGFLDDEHLVISPNLTVFYSITKSTPNAALKNFGHILANIPGDAVIVCENEDEPKDIPEDTLETLSDTLEQDTKARQEFLDGFRGHVVFV